MTSVVPIRPRQGRCVSAPPGAQRPTRITKRDIELAGGLDDLPRLEEFKQEIHRVRNTNPARAHLLSRVAICRFERKQREARGEQ